MPPDNKTDEFIMQITNLKGKYPHLKISNFAEADGIFRKYIRSDVPDVFLKNYVDMLTAYNFDGVDVDFEDLRNT